MAPLSIPVNIEVSLAAITRYAQSVLIGSGLTISGTGVVGGCGLGDDRVAMGFAALNELHMYEFNKSTATWSLLGTPLSIANLSQPAIAALTPTQIILADDNAQTLQAYEWNESTLTWSSIGTPLSFGSMTRPTLDSISPSKVVLVDQDNGMGVYEFDGSTLAQIGSTFNFPSTPGDPAVCYLIDNIVIEIDSNNNALKAYEWDGSNFTLKVTGPTIGNTNPALCTLDTERFVFWDEAGNVIELWKYDAENGTISTDAFEYQENVSAPVLMSINGVDIATWNQNNNLLRKRRFTVGIEFGNPRIAR